MSDGLERVTWAEEVVYDFGSPGEALPPPQSPRYWERIDDLWAATDDQEWCCGWLRAAVCYAVRARLQYGEVLGWITEHPSVSYRTFRRYCQLFRTYLPGQAAVLDEPPKTDQVWSERILKTAADDGRHDGLTLKHHMAVVGIEPERRTAWLARAFDEGWSADELERQVRGGTALAQAAPKPAVPLRTIRRALADPEQAAALLALIVAECTEAGRLELLHDLLHEKGPADLDRDSMEQRLFVVTDEVEATGAGHSRLVTLPGWTRELNHTTAADVKVAAVAGGP